MLSLRVQNYVRKDCYFRRGDEGQQFKGQHHADLKLLQGEQQGYALDQSKEYKGLIRSRHDKEHDRRWEDPLLGIKYEVDIT